MADKLNERLEAARNRLDSDGDEHGVCADIAAAIAELRRVREAPAPEIRIVAKRNLRSMIERGSTDRQLMLKCLEELS